MSGYQELSGIEKSIVLFCVAIVIYGFIASAVLPKLLKDTETQNCNGMEIEAKECENFSE